MYLDFSCTPGMPNEICNASLVHGIVSFGLKSYCEI